MIWLIDALAWLAIVVVLVVLIRKGTKNEP
jgi:hypothetical protein